MLIFRENLIDEISSSFIVDYLQKTTSLISLDLSHCALRETGGLQIAEALTNNSKNLKLREINLENNLIGTEAVEELSKYLGHNKVLESL